MARQRAGGLLQFVAGVGLTGEPGVLPDRTGVGEEEQTDDRRCEDEQCALDDAEQVAVEEEGLEKADRLEQEYEAGQHEPVGA